MPTPLVGSGDAVSKGLQISKFALYLAASTDSGAVEPTNKLGAASNPSGTWVRQGRLRDDSFQTQTGDPEIFTARAGWSRVAQWYAVRQAEDVEITIRLDERDPDVLAKLRGTLATSLSNGSNLGQRFIYTPGATYGAKVLLVGVAVDPGSAREKHIYAPSTTVTFKEIKEDDLEGIEVKIKLAHNAALGGTHSVSEWN